MNLESQEEGMKRQQEESTGVPAEIYKLLFENQKDYNNKVLSWISVLAIVVFLSNVGILFYFTNLIQDRFNNTIMEAQAELADSVRARFNLSREETFYALENIQSLSVMNLVPSDTSICSDLINSYSTVLIHALDLETDSRIEKMMVTNCLVRVEHCGTKITFNQYLSESDPPDILGGALNKLKSVPRLTIDEDVADLVQTISSWRDSPDSLLSEPDFPDVY